MEQMQEQDLVQNLGMPCTAALRLLVSLSPEPAVVSIPGEVLL